MSFAGKIAHSQIPPFYQKAQAFLMTSLSETFGLTLLESLSCGTPIVYPQCPLFTRLYEKDFPEQQFDLEHPDSFIKAVLSTEEPSLRPQCRSFAENHSWKKATQKLIELYQKVP